MDRPTFIQLILSVIYDQVSYKNYPQRAISSKKALPEESDNSGGSEITLEKLPADILEQIFGHLNQPQWLILCKLSRGFYWPAARLLYRQIIVICDHTLFIVPEVHLWRENKCTITSQVDKLLQVLTRKKDLAICVKSLIVAEMSTGETMESRKWMQKFAKLPNLNLTEMHFRDHPLDYVGPCPHTEGLFKTEVMSKMSICSHVKPVLSNLLTALEIIYEPKNAHEPKWFQGLAQSMISSGAHENLKTLVFASSPADFFGCAREYFQNPIEFPWVSFFNQFSQHKIRLQLKELGLTGFWKSDCIELVALLNATVELRNVHTLEIAMTEESHCHRDHPYDNEFRVSTFIDTLTALTPALETLSLDYDNTCETCQEETLERTLRFSVPNQLKRLYMHINADIITEEIELKDTILNYQQNLVILRRSNSYNMFLDEYEFDPINRIVRNYSVNKYVRRIITPCFFAFEEPKPLYEDKFMKIFKAKAKRISYMIQKDSILKAAREKLPHLQEYHAHSFTVDMKKFAIVLNDIFIPLRSSSHA